MPTGNPRRGPAPGAGEAKPRKRSGDALRVFVVAGEASGDAQASHLLEALRQRIPGCRFEGVGGPQMRAVGVQTHFDSAAWGAIGFLESLKLVPRLLSAKREAVRLIRRSAPDLLLLVDFGAFNVRLARSVRSLVPRVAYYFPPGSWKRRPASPELAKLTDLVVTPFPWSAEALKAVGANAHFVGHPLLDTARPRMDAARFREVVGLKPERPTVALLPGSRAHELRALLPILAESAERLLVQCPEAQFVMALAPTVQVEDVARLTGRSLTPGRGEEGPSLAGTLLLSGEGRCALVRNGTYDAMGAADVVLTCSGTATLEAALLEKPLVLFYRVQGASIVEGFFRRRGIGRIGLPNILAQRQICPELIQEALTPDRLAAEALDLLQPSERRSRMVEDLRALKRQLGEPGALDRAADLVADLLMREAPRNPANP